MTEKENADMIDYEYEELLSGSVSAARASGKETIDFFINKDTNSVYYERNKKETVLASAFAVAAVVEVHKVDRGTYMPEFSSIRYKCIGYSKTARRYIDFTIYPSSLGKSKSKSMDDATSKGINFYTAGSADILDLYLDASAERARLLNGDQTTVLYDHSGWIHNPLEGFETDWLEYTQPGCENNASGGWMKRQGTAEAQIAALNRLLEDEHGGRNPLICLTMAASVAGVFRHLPGMNMPESPAFVLVGESNLGKSVALRAACSLYGNYTSMTFSPSSTDISIEAKTKLHNHAMFSIDEMANMFSGDRNSPSQKRGNTERIVTMLNSATVRTKMIANEEGGHDVHESQTSAFVMTASAQTSIHDICRGDEQYMALITRLVESHYITGNNPIINYNHGANEQEQIANRKAYITEIENALNSNYGHIIPVIVEKLLDPEYQEQAIKTFHEAMAHYSRRAGQAQRHASIFALFKVALIALQNTLGFSNSLFVDTMQLMDELQMRNSSVAIDAGKDNALKAIYDKLCAFVGNNIRAALFDHDETKGLFPHYWPTLQRNLEGRDKEQLRYALEQNDKSLNSGFKNIMLIQQFEPMQDVNQFTGKIYFKKNADGYSQLPEIKNGQFKLDDIVRELKNAQCDYQKKGMTYRASRYLDHTCNLNGGKIRPRYEIGLHKEDWFVIDMGKLANDLAIEDALGTNEVIEEREQTTSEIPAAFVTRRVVLDDNGDIPF